MQKNIKSIPNSGINSSSSASWSFSMSFLELFKKDDSDIVAEALRSKFETELELLMVWNC